jgi:glycosyltransferase involved in cell wall biosynthesis
MGDTLRKSLESIMSQIDERFEVVLLDDGSQDESVSIGREMSNKHKNLIFIPLKRDPNRRLGQTRNLSIKHASGEWCIFHLDTDDEVGNHIQEFVFAITELSKLLPKDVLFSGQQIHMGRREFLLKHGPFQNIYRGEDRDLYMRLVRTSEWIVIKHSRFIKRYERSWRKLLVKNMRDNFDQTVNDLQSKPHPLTYLHESMANRSNLSTRIILFRFLVLPLALREAKKRGILSRSGYPTHEEFLAYRKANTRSFSEWFSDFGSSLPDQIDKTIFY